jgi:hypothetical protein
MKIGDEVELYWDGKSCRGVTGLVIATNKGHHITVKYTPWADETGVEITSRFRMTRGYRRSSRKFFHGWAKDIKTGEKDWYYKIMKKPKNQENVCW